MEEFDRLAADVVRLRDDLGDAEIALYLFYRDQLQAALEENVRLRKRLGDQEADRCIRGGPVALSNQRRSCGKGLTPTLSLRCVDPPPVFEVVVPAVRAACAAWPA
jgi:hypothetical protein